MRVGVVPISVIEILSPTQSPTDLLARSLLYFEADVQSHWLVLPDLTTIYVFSGPNEYEAYVKTGTPIDSQLSIELELETIFK